MQMVRAPEQFEVIVTNNMFGDIITDLGAALQGGLGVAASANLHPGRISMFEPVHGSAPKYAGTGQRQSGRRGALGGADARRPRPRRGRGGDRARGRAEPIRDGQTTHDLGGSLTTSQVGDLLARARGRAERPSQFLTRAGDVEVDR